ncbi:MAG: hypothetical protein ACYDEP_03250 [Acidimicrobiales bacterium]
MIREGSVPGWEQTISLQAEGRAVPAVADHHQVIVQDNPVPAARSSDGTKGALLGFGGAGGPPAAVPDEDAGAGLARLRPEEDRASGRAGGPLERRSQRGAPCRPADAGRPGGASTQCLTTVVTNL